MQIIHTPLKRPARENDVTRWLVDAIAKELWALHGGGGILDWAGAERGLSRIVEQAREGVRKSVTTSAAVAVASNGPTGSDGLRGRTKRAVVWRPGGGVGPLHEPRRRLSGTALRKDVA